MEGKGNGNCKGKSKAETLRKARVALLKDIRVPGQYSGIGPKLAGIIVDMYVR